MEELSSDTKASLDKARQSALLAVEVYNKPAVPFKSGGYISLMIIAWTALFHAIFFRRGTPPYYTTKEGKFQVIDGDNRHWELTHCLGKYFLTDTQHPVRKNLKLFIKLRNQVEHRSMPEIDPLIFGECQAMLFNFDDMLMNEFGEDYCLREALSFAIQFYPSARSLGQALSRNPTTQSAITLIQEFRSSISTKTLEDGRFAFKAFLIRVANHQTDDALPIQIYDYDSLSDEQKSSLDQIGLLVKATQPSIANKDLFSPKQVVKRVQKGLDNSKVLFGGKSNQGFTVDCHTRCWKHFQVRPKKDSSDPSQTDVKYCIYDARHRDWGYTEAWVQKLIRSFRDTNLYEELYNSRSTS